MKPPPMVTLLTGQSGDTFARYQVTGFDAFELWMYRNDPAYCSTHRIAIQERVSEIDRLRLLLHSQAQHKAALFAHLDEVLRSGRHASCIWMDSSLAQLWPAMDEISAAACAAKFRGDAR